MMVSLSFRAKRLTGKAKRSRWDSNPQSPAPEASALSIRPRDQVAFLMKRSYNVRKKVRCYLNTFVFYIFKDKKNDDS